MENIEINDKNINIIESLMQWKISKNHTGLWGCIKGIYSRNYEFMHEDKVEVIKYIIKNENIRNAI